MGGERCRGAVEGRELKGKAVHASTRFSILDSSLLYVLKLLLVETEHQ